MPPATNPFGGDRARVGVDVERFADEVFVLRDSDSSLS